MEESWDKDCILAGDMKWDKEAVKDESMLKRVWCNLCGTWKDEDLLLIIRLFWTHNDKKDFVLFTGEVDTQRLWQTCRDKKKKKRNRFRHLTGCCSKKIETEWTNEQETLEAIRTIYGCEIFCRCLIGQNVTDLTQDWFGITAYLLEHTSLKGSEHFLWWYLSYSGPDCCKMTDPKMLGKQSKFL